jgi:WD40 repeat protein
MQSQYSGDVVCCAVSPDGGTVVSGARDGKIRVWNARTGDKLHTRDKHAEWVLGIAFNADGSTFVSAGYDGSVRVWRTSAAECIASLKQDHLAVVCCGFSRSDKGRFVVAGTHVGDVFVWDHQTKAVRNVATHSGAVWSCCFSSCDKFILSSSNSKSLMLSDSAAETVLRTFTCTAPVHQAMFLGHGATHILSCGRDNAVTAWDAASGRKLGTFEGHTDHVMRMAVYAGEYLLTCSWDTTCCVWKLPDVLKDVVRAQAPPGHVPRTPPF